MRVAHQNKSRTSATPEAPSGRAHERRAYVRARLPLPLWVCRIAGQAGSVPPMLRVHDISSSGAFFLCPEKIDPGTPLSLEVSLVGERRRHRAVRMCVDAHVVRTEAAEKDGWHGLAVAFDDIRYVRNRHLSEPLAHPRATS
jgi:hypothetical protein